MPANGVKVVDRGWSQIVKTLKEVSKGGGMVAAVGIQGDKAAEDHDGITNAELGAIHEYGSKDGRIPERSHFRSTMLDEEATLTKELQRVAKEVYSGKDPEPDLRMAGESFRAKVIDKIKGGIEPELADATLAKGRGTGPPLWDTGQYVNSISVEISTLNEKQAG